ncbi:MAG TPA: hypothetical protein VD713_02070, partial [Sphingomonadales bacterium]|nr:hypothetical protein [Sphingomonadales bacterium]
RMSAPEIAIRMQSLTADKTATDLKAQYAESVRAFREEEIEQFQKIVAANRERLERVAGLLPETIYFIRTSAKVEGGLGHTQANAIIVPEPNERLTTDLLLHEVFHVLSRHQDAKRAELYALIGFRFCAFDEPDALAAIHLTNPDVPAEAYYFALGEGEGAMPFLYASRGAFDPTIARGFAGHLGFGLVRLKVENGVCQAVLGDDGQPVPLLPPETPAFFEAIGRNTDYIIHPEEVLADNFSLLMQGTQNLPNPEILERLAAWLGLD